MLVVEPNLAYIDPGSGSLLIQVIIASILAIPYFLRTQIGRAIGLVRGKAKPSRARAGEPNGAIDQPR